MLRMFGLYFFSLRKAQTKTSPPRTSHANPWSKNCGKKCWFFASLLLVSVTMILDISSLERSQKPEEARLPVLATYTLTKLPIKSSWDVVSASANGARSNEELAGYDQF